MNFKISLSYSTKNTRGVSTEIALNLLINLENIVVLTIQNLWILWMSSYLFKPLISFDNILLFWEHKFCISFVKFVPKHLIFWCYYKLVCFLDFVFELLIDNISKLSQFLFLDFVSWNLAETVSSKSFLVNSLKFSTY